MRLLVTMSLWLFLVDGLLSIAGGWARANAVIMECFELSEKLTDNSAETRDLLTRKFAAGCGNELMHRSMAERLTKSIQMGNSTAAALLLLRNAWDIDSKALLKERQMHPTRDVRWAQDSQPVSESVVALVARLSKFEEEVKPGVMALASNPGVAGAEFLLDALPYIGDRDVMVQIARLLDDARTLPNRPPFRICDYAARAFVKQLKLKPSFDVSALVVYDEPQLQEIRRLTARALPR